ncbi:MAG: hypothetical protein WCJ58_00355 [bacterium]
MSKLQPQDVLEKLIACFVEAHCTALQFETNDLETSNDYCISVIKKAFEETGGNFDKPTKDSILAVTNWLANFSANFRRPEIIKKNYNKMMGYIDQL